MKLLRHAGMVDREGSDAWLYMLIPSRIQLTTCRLDMRLSAELRPSVWYV